MKKRISIIVFLAVIFAAINTSLVLAADVSDLVFQGADLHFRGKLQEAAVLFKKALAEDPDNEYARNQLALILAKQKKFKQSFAEFEKVAAQSPNNTFARTWMGVFYLQQGKVDKAFDEFETIIKLDSGNANAYYFMGVIYMVEHNMAKAVKFLRKAQDADSDDPETHFRLATAFSGMDMPYNARLEYERALTLSPKMTKAINGLGWLYFNGGDIDKAVSSWKKALELEPKNPDAKYNLAKVYNDLAFSDYKSGRKKEAKKKWEQTLLYEPSNKAAKYYLRKLR